MLKVWEWEKSAQGVSVTFFHIYTDWNFSFPGCFYGIHYPLYYFLDAHCPTPSQKMFPPVSVLKFEYFYIGKNLHYFIILLFVAYFCSLNAIVSFPHSLFLLILLTHTHTLITFTLIILLTHTLINYTLIVNLRFFLIFTVDHFPLIVLSFLFHFTDRHYEKRQSSQNDTTLTSNRQAWVHKAF